jgi:hypothetical protein
MLKANRPSLLAVDLEGELANVMALFDAVGFATDPSVLRDTFGVSAFTIEEWTREDR